VSLDIDSGEGTERFREQVAQAVRAGLGERVDTGTWKLTLRRLPRDQGVLVDLNNNDGLARQWVFDPSEPIATVIQRDLKGST
jgi:hypothetical protein